GLPPITPNPILTDEKTAFRFRRRFDAEVLRNRWKAQTWQVFVAETQAKMFPDPHRAWSIDRPARSITAAHHFSRPHRLCIPARQLQMRSRETATAMASSCFESIRSSFPPHQFFVTRMPISFGSVRNTLVVKPLSSLFRKVPVMAVVLKMFLS